MILVEKILGRFEDFDVDELEIDRVSMVHYELVKPHQRIKSQKGKDLAISLSQGEQLFYGAVLYEDGQQIIVVDLVPEEVLEIHPRGNIQWAQVAFNIGNMHQPAYLQEDCILIPYDNVMERLVRALNVGYKKCQRKLTGLRANITVGSEHSHGHSHEHAHGHSHEHSHGEDHE